MYNRRFFDSKLGHAAIASIAAMVAMIAVSTQLNIPTAQAAPIAYETPAVEIA